MAFTDHGIETLMELIRMHKANPKLLRDELAESTCPRPSSDGYLMTQLTLEWKPRNITEWMFVRDITDISWEIYRHRRAIANLFAISFKVALRAVLTDVLEEGWIGNYDTAKELAQAWFEGPQEQEKVKAQLAKYGLSPEAIVAQSYVLRRDELDKLHRLLAVAEARRIVITRHFNEYRATSLLAQKPVVEGEQVALVPNST
jgi:hypothetical protein